MISTATPDRGRAAALWTFAIASLLAIALGALVMAQGDVPVGIWIRNPVAWAIAVVLSLVLARVGWLRPALPPIALAVIALSFIGAGQEGVHRWLDLGPVQLNAAGLVLPAAIPVFSRSDARYAVPCFAMIAAALAWQPDVSQLAAFAIATIILSAHRFGWRGAVVSVIASAAAIALCLSRPDPLQPVPHVEEIFRMAWDQAPAFSLAMGASLGAAALSPLLLWLTPTLRWQALALSAYFIATSAAPAFGAYPVPLAGHGLSFVLGWWLGLAMLTKPEPTAGAIPRNPDAPSANFPSRIRPEALPSCRIWIRQPHPPSRRAHTSR